MTEFTLNHVSVTCCDLAGPKDFYGRILGLEEIFRPDFGYEGIWYRLSGGVELHIIVNPAPRTPQLAQPVTDRVAHFALSVPDSEAVCRKLDEIGYRYLRAASTAGRNRLFVFDSDQNMIEIFGPLTESISK